jgi:hypothetical protein
MTASLNQQGYRVLRFWNEQVITELEGVYCKLFMSPDGFLIAHQRRRADKGPFLGAQKKGAVLPLSGEENYPQIV